MEGSRNIGHGVSIIRIVSEFYPIIGGSVTHVIELAKKIDNFLSDQIIIAPDYGCNCAEYDSDLGIPIKRIKFSPIKKRFGVPVTPLNNLLYMVKIYRYLKKEKRTGILQTHGIAATAFGVAIGKLLNLPVVGMLHGSLEAYSNLSGFYETMLARIFKPNHAFVLDDGSCAPNKFKSIWNGSVTVVNHAIDTNYFKNMNKTSTLLDKYNLKKSDFIILSTSSLNAVKRIDLAIKIFEILSGIIKSSNVYLLIAGDGKLKDELIKYVENKKLQNILFLGSIAADEIPHYLSISDVVVGTSLYSNLNRSIQEAMACEKPVVAFNSGGTSKLIKHMNNGILVEPGNIREFAEYIKLLYENQTFRSEIGKNARQTIIKERSWDARINTELQVYKNLLNSRSQSSH